MIRNKPKIIPKEEHTRNYGLPQSFVKDKEINYDNCEDTTEE